MSEKTSTQEISLFGDWGTVETNDFEYAASSNKDDAPKLDIWDELRNADLKNLDFYNDLSPELQKQFSSFVAMRWFTCIPDGSKYRDFCLILVNELLNLNFSAFSAGKSEGKDHPELQWKLLAACGPGISVKRNIGFIKPSRKRKEITKVQEFMLRWYPDANDDELNILTKNMDREGFENFIKSTGATDAELKELLAAHDESNGIVPEKATKGKKRKAKD